MNRDTYFTYSNMKYRTSGKFRSKKMLLAYSGVTVCKRWLDSFDNFVEDMGYKPDGLELDRIDNSKGYYKENCRWVTRGANQFNRSKFKGNPHLPVGVFSSSDKKKFVSQICINKKKYHLGTFNTSEQARKVYEEVSLEWYGYIN